MAWWVWIVFGFVLLGGELVTPGGFYVLFFGVSGICVGLITALVPGFPLWGQWLLFTVFAVLSLLVFRRPLLEWFRRRTPSTEVDNLVGETAMPMEDIAVNAVGKAELRGATWNARNVGDKLLARAQRCRVRRVDGLTLDIEG
jgi:membrane protein implicated in regulation of membrane protease activity